MAFPFEDEAGARFVVLERTRLQQVLPILIAVGYFAIPVCMFACMARGLGIHCQRSGDNDLDCRVETSAIFHADFHDVHAPGVKHVILRKENVGSNSTSWLELQTSMGSLPLTPRIATGLRPDFERASTQLNEFIVGTGETFDFHEPPRVAPPEYILAAILWPLALMVLLMGTTRTAVKLDSSGTTMEVWRQMFPIRAGKQWELPLAEVSDLVVWAGRRGTQMLYLKKRDQSRMLVGLAGVQDVNLPALRQLLFEGKSNANR